MRRTTVSLDDDLLDQARQITGITEVSNIVNEGLRELIRADAARRLIALGGTVPDAQAPSRRRPA